jgi:hypothetical protein
VTVYKVLIRCHLEVNIAENAEAFAAGTHPGYEQTAWDGLEQIIGILAKKRTKVIINRGAQNPRGLAERTRELVSVTFTNRVM